MEYMIKNVFGLRWNCKELKGIVKLRFFRVAKHLGVAGIHQHNELVDETNVTLFAKESMEYMMKNVFGLRWNCKELKGIVKLRFFRVAKHLGVAGIHQHNELVDETNVTLFAK
nr:hypothetical protein [Tanacetum cinerariifolium]